MYLQTEKFISYTNWKWLSLGEAPFILWKAAKKLEVLTILKKTLVYYYSFAFINKKILRFYNNPNLGLNNQANEKQGG